MKKNLHHSIVLLVLFLSVVQNATAQWRWNYPSPQGNELKSSSFISANEGWLAGNKGALLHTTNGGQNWTPKYTSYYDNIGGVYFSSTNNGYVGQGSYFLSTTNTGTTWTVKNYFSGMTIRKMFFLNVDSGWICGFNGVQEQLLFTADGGVNWTTQISPTNAINDIEFLNSGYGWFACNDGSIYNTVNFGQSWNNATITGNPTLNNIQFVDNSIGYASADNGHLYKSTDGGLTWNPVVNPASNSSIGLKALYFTNSDSGFVAGTDGFNLQTTDGGTTWSVIGLSGWFQGNRIEAVSPNELFLTGSNGEILHSVDYGATWTSQQTRVAENNLHGIVSLSSTTLFSCGDNGTILQSTNGGQAWTLVTSNVTDNLHSIAFENSTTGVAVGNSGQIVQTTNGGSTWSSVTSGTSEDLLSVCKVNATSFYACGNNAELTTSIDNGNTWSDVPTILSGSPNIFTDIYFTTQDSGWIATDGQQVLYTYDGGVNWNITVIPTPGPINSIYFVDSNNGWLCTANGEILNSTDAGVTWNINATNYIGSFNKIIFTDASNGWALGDREILRTNDGGTSWNEEIDPSENSIQDAVFLNGTDAIAVGTGLGTVLARSGDLHLSIPSNDLCTDLTYNLTLTASGTFNTGNHFNVELSDNFGSFQFPYQIGSVLATGSTVVFITVPGGIPDGPGYRLRVISTNPPSYSPAFSGVLTVHTSPNAYAVAAGSTAFCTGDSVTIYTNYDPTWTYQWYQDGIPIPNATADSVVGYTTGNFTVTVSDGICSQTSPIVDLLVSNCIGINELSRNSIYKAYPNPTSDNLIVSWPENQIVKTLTLRDISGRIIDVMNHEESNSAVIDLQSYSSGVYFLTIAGTSPTTLRIVKY